MNHPIARLELATVFRMAARFGWNESIGNHFSLAVSDDGKQFLVNPKGRHFSLIKASELLLLNANDQNLTNPLVDKTAWAIHSAIHQKQQTARCILHVHSTYATVLASLANKKLPPIDQNTCRFYQRIAIDNDFNGMGLGNEAKRYPPLLNEHPILLMGNHGVLITAPTIALAFDELYFFERACKTYILALATNQALAILPPEIAQKTASQWQDYNKNSEFARLFLKQCQEILDKEEPNYAN